MNSNFKKTRSSMIPGGGIIIRRLVKFFLSLFKKNTPMKHEIFISYAGPDIEIVKNLRDRFAQYGVKAWVYSEDSTLAEKTWPEITQKLNESSLIVFIVSKNTATSQGQSTELDLAVKKIGSALNSHKIMPIFISGTDTSIAPHQLRIINGDFIDGDNVKSIALKITKQIFPFLLDSEGQKPWKYPIPGEWLEVAKVNAQLERDFELGDKLYFRAISPIGLFECYSLKIQGLYWISPDNVKHSHDVEVNKELESQIPYEFTIMGMIDIVRLGWENWQKS